MTLADFRARHSVRNYLPDPLTHGQTTAINAAITLINTHEAGMHFSLVTDDDAPFKGFARSYGFFSGVRNYIVAVADTSFAWHRVRAGFCGMELVMKLQKMGLGSCFVSGTFSASHVDARIKPGEELLFLITLGKEDGGRKPGLLGRVATAFIHRKTPDPGQFLESDLPRDILFKEIPNLREALEALACAPSALNKRPARLVISRCEDSELKIQMRVPEGNPAYEIDLGIALYPVSTILGGVWEYGNPSTLLR